MADRTGATVDEWTHHQVTGVDAFAVAEDGTSVNVMRTPSEHVPTPAELADEVRALQMDAVRWGRTETVFGPATTLRSTLTLFGGAGSGCPAMCSGRAMTAGCSAFRSRPRVQTLWTPCTASSCAPCNRCPPLPKGVH